MSLSQIFSEIYAADCDYKIAPTIKEMREHFVEKKFTIYNLFIYEISLGFSIFAIELQRILATDF
jgi:hypothetical protein